MMPNADGAVARRPPATVMRLDRMGAMFATRLSFLRVMLRRARREAWRVTRPVWSLDGQGCGHAVYQVALPGRVVSLVAFAQNLPAERRTDRVIADAWDTSYVLYDGIPDSGDIARLAANVPLQEAGRFTERDLILSRANKSVRLFESVAATLAQGGQPDAATIAAVGYLMRTTAVYGNGKFGIADRARLAAIPQFAGPFQAEMLTVWLIRAFTVDLVEHRARGLSADAVRLAPALRRSFGVGNATGLGMAPFLVRHPLLLHRWIDARETALARVRALPAASAAARAAFAAHLHAAAAAVEHWHTADPVQAGRLDKLRADLAQLLVWGDTVLSAPSAGDAAGPWDALYRRAEAALSLDGQECAVALLLEPHGALVDDLADTMGADEGEGVAIDGRMECAALRRLIAETYAWALAMHPAPQPRFWYVSAEKLEPRLGERAIEPGAELEQPLNFAGDVARLLAALPDRGTVAAFLLAQPDWRHVVRRVQIVARYPYGEIRDNLVAAEMRPIDLLRCKLACFGAARFDPRSDRWLRITLFQGAPFPDDINSTAENAAGLAA